MMKKNISTMLLACLAASVGVQAQIKPVSQSGYSEKSAALVQKYKAEFANMANAEMDQDVEDVALSPYIYQLTSPIYYSSVLSDKLKIGKGADAPLLASDGMQYRQQLTSSVGDALLDVYTNNPSIFHYYDSQIASESVVTPAKVKNAKKEDLNVIYEKVVEVKDVTSVVNDVDFDVQIEKPNFWATSGKFTTQFTQSYFSENWYKGGSNNVTLLSTLLLEANYNDQKKIQWDNKLDLRLGFVSTPSDTCHSFMTNNDKIYLASKLGIKATKAWFYTIQADVNTQFLSGFRTNKKETFSKFLAPLDVFVSVGMDFKPTIKKGSFSAALLPFSYKMRYIGSDDDSNTIHKTYAMMKDDRALTTKHDFGSKVEFNAKFELVKNLTWRSRAYYYTTYEYVEAEWENAFSFQFNKYLSTEVNTLWRFDDNRKRDPEVSLRYFQFKEYFTFGLAYNF